MLPIKDCFCFAKSLARISANRFALLCHVFFNNEKHESHERFASQIGFATNSRICFASQKYLATNNTNLYEFQCSVL